MTEIHWQSVIEYCQEAASRGELPTHLFTDQRQKDLPAKYAGEPTLWPSEQEAFRHFAENPEAWELVRKGYEWRSLKLYDRIEGYRKKLERGDMGARDATVLINSCFTEIKHVGAAAVKEIPVKVEDKKPASESDDVAARLARARARDLASEEGAVSNPPKGRVTKGQSMLPAGFQGKKRPMQ